MCRRNPMWLWPPALLLALFFALPRPALAQEKEEAKVWKWRLQNHTMHHYRDQIIELGVTPDVPYSVDGLIVLEDGKEVAYQVEIIEGDKRQVKKGRIWVMTSIEPEGRHDYEIKLGRGKHFEDEVKVTTAHGRYHTLSNGKISVRVPTADRVALAPPIVAYQREDKDWLGSGRFVTERLIDKVDVKWLAEGPLFAEVKLHYTFKKLVTEEKDEEIEAPWLQAIIRLPAKRPFAEVTEHFGMTEKDHWLLSLSDSWQTPPKWGMFRRWYNEKREEVDTDYEERRLLPDRDLGGYTMMYLRPRWSPSPNVAWFFGANDGAQVAGAVAARAGRWTFPYENSIDVVGTNSGRDATLKLPTHRGSRYWLFFVGQKSDVYMKSMDFRRPGKFKTDDKLEELVLYTQMQSLQRLTHEFILDYPYVKPGGYRGEWYYGNKQSDPTGTMKLIGQSLLDSVHEGSIPRGDRTTLTNMQARFDPDFFGYYHNGWSPVQPDYGTIITRVPMLQVASLKDHPRYKEFCKLAENAMRAELHYNITLPGGAGQAAPGYQIEQMRTWYAMAEICKKNYGFDPTQWPRYQAAAQFIWRTAVVEPRGKGRRLMPMGETQAPGLWTPAKRNADDLHVFVKDFYPGGRLKRGLVEDPRKWNTEEYPGFGVIFRAWPGWFEETYMAFKAGPNRGRYQGDQLAFHYVTVDKRMAVDHMAGSEPYYGQEHMHNRLSFSSLEFPFANMDGYERLIAFKTSSTADVAIGQVESNRLRKVTKVPPMDRYARGPYQEFPKPLVYRRTVVFMKQGIGGKARPRVEKPGDEWKHGVDYFVIRDQYDGPLVNVAYNLHVDSRDAKKLANTVEFDGMSFFVVTPVDYDFERFDWTNTEGPNPGAGKGGKHTAAESTKGIRLKTAGSSVNFITVLYPTPKGEVPHVTAVEQGGKVIGVRIAEKAGKYDEVHFLDPKPNEDDPNKQPPPVVLKRSGATIPLLKYTDIDLERSQGEVGLFIPEAAYDLGPMPEWLLKQRGNVPADISTDYLQLPGTGPAPIHMYLPKDGAGDGKPDTNLSEAERRKRERAERIRKWREAREREREDRRRRRD